jgi:hypothetical protein
MLQALERHEIGEGDVIVPRANRACRRWLTSTSAVMGAAPV